MKMSEVKAISPINTVIKSMSYLPKGKAYELQTWYTDGAQRPVSLTSAVNCMVKLATSHGAS